MCQPSDIRQGFQIAKYLQQEVNIMNDTYLLSHEAKAQGRRSGIFVSSHLPYLSRQAHRIFYLFSTTSNKK